jgi:hypothetical protein
LELLSTTQAGDTTTSYDRQKRTDGPATRFTVTGTGVCKHNDKQGMLYKQYKQ